MVSLIHLRQLEAARRLGKRRKWSDEDEEGAKEAPELTEEERLLRAKVYDAGDIL